MPSVGNVILASVLPIVQVVLMCAAGAVAAVKGVLTAEGQRALSRTIYYIFLPALIVVSLGSSATGSQLLSWWFLAANIGINVALGLALGAVMLRALAVPRHLWRAFLACACVGNLGNFPLLLIDAIPRHAEQFEDTDGEQGTTYVLCSLFAICLAAFALGGFILRKPTRVADGDARDAAGVADVELAACKGQVEGGAMLEAQTPRRRASRGESAARAAEVVGECGRVRRTSVLMCSPRVVETDCEAGRSAAEAGSAGAAAEICSVHVASSSTDATAVDLRVASCCSTPTASCQSDERAAIPHAVARGPDQRGSEAASVSDRSPPGRASRRKWWSRVVRVARVLDGALLNAPTLAVLLGIFVAVVPPINGVFFGDEDDGGGGGSSDKPPLDVFTQAGHRLGAAMIPSLMLTLGASLSRGPGAHVPWRAIAGLTTLRLVLLPVLGTLCVVGLRRWGAFEPPDQIFMLVLLLQQAMPSALNIYTLAVVNDAYAGEIATMLFWQYVAAVVTIPACVAAFLVII